MEPRKIGRPHKGDRKFVSFKLPTQLLVAMRRHAADHGVTATDLVGELIAAEVGMPYQNEKGIPLSQMR